MRRPPPPNRGARYLTTTTAARRAGVAPYTVQKWFDRGILTGVKLPSGHRRISAVSFERFLRNRTQGASLRTKPDRYRVLVVEDELALQALLKEGLARHGYEVRTASTGVQAGLAIAEFQPHCLVLDMLLEDVHGATLVRQIRAAESGRHMRVVAISGQAEPKDVKAVLAAGADTFLEKPFPLSSLLAAVRSRPSTKGTIFR